jgi:hypothetical protein
LLLSYHREDKGARKGLEEATETSYFAKNATKKRAKARFFGAFYCS